MKAKQLDQDVKLASREQSASSRLPGLAECPPSLMATADVHELILEVQKKRMQEEFGEDFPTTLALIADVSQSTNRGQTSLFGSWGTLTTSSLLLNFRVGKFLHPLQHMAMIGFDVTSLKTKGLRVIMFLDCVKSRKRHPACVLYQGLFLAAACRKDWAEMTRNAMTLSQSVKVLLPLAARHPRRAPRHGRFPVSS